MFKNETPLITSEKITDTHYKPLTVAEQKKIALDILSDVADFCDKHNLLYYLAYGTLIGAVRHKGYIPWDDDIDIQMPRDDYEKLISIFNDKSESPYLKLLSPYDRDSKHTFVKIVNTNTVKIESGIEYKANNYAGIDIDIFPLDGQPDDDKEFIREFKRKKVLYWGHYFAMSNSKDGRFRRRIAVNLFRWCRLINKNLFIKKYNDTYPYVTSKYVGCTASLYNSINNRHLKKHYEQRVKMRFEDKEFWAPKGYDAILTDMYGDYMKLPPEEAQVTHHGNKCYLKLQ